MQRYRPPTFGTVPFKGDRATKLGRFSDWLDTTLDSLQPDALAWERPILMPSDTVDLIELLYGMVGIAYAARWKRRLPFLEVPIHDAKRALTGSGRADKDQMITAAMSTMHWSVATHHEADAGAVGMIAYDNLFPRETDR
jgi:Holliday junction resolvasome RuvABC endonuclease subunit